MTGASYESLALATVLPYPPPLVKFSSDPGPFEFWWKFLYYVFRLPSPYKFPAPPDLVLTDTLSRYCNAAKDLASSACLAYGASVNVQVERGANGLQVESVTSDFPSAELIRGFLTLFRQFYSNAEAASFTKVKSILMGAAKRASDTHAERRLTDLKAWGKAQGQLRAFNLKYLVGQRLTEEGRFGGGIPDEGSPETLISAFSYGEHLHWGDKRDQVAGWQADQFLGPWHQIRFLEAVAGLAHLYMGYAVIVSRSIRRADLLA